MIDVKNELDLNNAPDLVRRKICGIFEKNDLRENFRFLLGYKENSVYESKESSVLKSIMDTFEGENIETQYHVLNYKIGLYFHDYN